VKVTINGIADVNRVLREIAPREAQNLARVTVTEIAKQLAADAKANAPADQGDLGGAITFKRERGRKGVVAASAGVNKSAFYWRFLEYGQGPDGVEYAYWLNAFQKMKADIDRIYVKIFAQKLVARLARLNKTRG